jgi:hypothetical protein
MNESPPPYDNKPPSYNESSHLSKQDTDRRVEELKREITTLNQYVEQMNSKFQLIYKQKEDMEHKVYILKGRVFTILNNLEYAVSVISMMDVGRIQKEALWRSETELNRELVFMEYELENEAKKLGYKSAYDESD